METKPGTRTTEFWLILIGANVAPIAMVVAEVLPPKYAVIAMATGNALYAIARGLAKQGTKPDEPQGLTIKRP